MFVGLFVGVFVFTLRVAQLRYAHADAKLLAAILTLEDERLPGFVFRLIEDGEVVALRTTYAFHDSAWFFIFMTHPSAKSRLLLRKGRRAS